MVEANKLVLGLRENPNDDVIYTFQVGYSQYDVTLLGEGDNSVAFFDSDVNEVLILSKLAADNIPFDMSKSIIADMVYRSIYPHLPQLEYRGKTNFRGNKYWVFSSPLYITPLDSELVFEDFEPKDKFEIAYNIGRQLARVDHEAARIQPKAPVSYDLIKELFDKVRVHYVSSPPHMQQYRSVKTDLYALLDFVTKLGMANVFNLDIFYSNLAYDAEGKLILLDPLYPMKPNRKQKADAMKSMPDLEFLVENM